MKKDSENKDSQRVFAWCLYDWANSAFSTVIITFVFSVYFARGIIGDETQGAVLWSYTIAASGLAVALLGPVLGAMSDIKGQKKPFLVIFTAISIVSTAFLWFGAPKIEGIAVILILLALFLANTGFEMAQIFYNAMLPDLASQEKRGRVSGLAWGLGYAGGLVALALTLFVLVGFGEISPFLGLPEEESLNIRASVLLTSVWFFLFSLPLFFSFQEAEKGEKSPFFEALRQGVSLLFKTLKKTRQYPDFIRFLIASAIYRDGLVTLFAVGGIYAAGKYGMSFSEILIFALGLNITAGIGAAAFAFVEDRIGSKKVIISGLCGLILIGALILISQDKNLFILLGLALGVFVGPVQAASRAYVSELAPQNLFSQSYGLYAFTGKSIAFLGPLLFGLMTSLFQSQDAGMAVIILFWVFGLIILRGIKNEYNS